MGSDGSKLAAFQSDVHATGLDLRKSSISRDLGVWRAADAAEFEQGQMLSLNADNELVLADGGNVLGVAKHNKINLQKAAIVDEVATVTASGVSQLKHGNVSNLVVRTAPDQGGTAITATGDYVLSAANGTLTWEASPAEVSDGDTVYVSYTYDLTNSDYKFQGRNFFNGLDDAEFADGRMTVVLEGVLFTTQFDTAQTYAMTGTGSNLYCGGATPGLEGLFTNDSAEGTYVGKVIQLPTAEHPYLGVLFHGKPEEEA